MSPHPAPTQGSTEARKRPAWPRVILPRGGCADRHRDTRTDTPVAIRALVGEDGALWITPDAIEDAYVRAVGSPIRRVFRRVRARRARHAPRRRSANATRAGPDDDPGEPSEPPAPADAPLTRAGVPTGGVVTPPVGRAVAAERDVRRALRRHGCRCDARIDVIVAADGVLGAHVQHRRDCPAHIARLDVGEPPVEVIEDWR